VQSEDKERLPCPKSTPSDGPIYAPTLVDQRRIPGSLVDEAHARGDVYATLHQGYSNAVFIRRDDEGQAVGAYMRGTRGRFYGMAKDSDRSGLFFRCVWKP
jgi:hypothetical protein